MRNKILTALAPVLAIAAFAVVPAMAQATTIQVNSGSAAGKTVQAVSENLEFQAGEATLECKINDLKLFVQNPPNQADVVGGYFSGEGGTEAAPTPCPTNNPEVELDITTNAATSHWQAHFEANDQGTLQGSEGIQFTAQFQPTGVPFSIATCHYYAPSVAFTYNQGAQLTITVPVNNPGQFELESPEQEGNLIPCPADANGHGQLHGSFDVSSTEGLVTVDP